jgi:hypothetical protein
MEIFPLERLPAKAEPDTLPSHGYILDTDHNGAFFVRSIARPLKIIGCTFAVDEGGKLWSSTSGEKIICHSGSRAEALGGLLIALREAGL